MGTIRDVTCQYRVGIFVNTASAVNRLHTNICSLVMLQSGHISSPSLYTSRIYHTGLLNLFVVPFFMAYSDLHLFFNHASLSI